MAGGIASPTRSAKATARKLLQNITPPTEGGPLAYAAQFFEGAIPRMQLEILAQNRGDYPEGFMCSAYMAALGEPIDENPEAVDAALDKAGILARKARFQEWLTQAKIQDTSGQLEGIEPIPQMILDLGKPTYPLRPLDPETLKQEYEKIREFSLQVGKPLRAKHSAASQGLFQLKIPYVARDGSEKDIRKQKEKIEELINLAHKFRQDGPYIIQAEVPHTYMRYVAYVEPSTDQQAERLWQITEKRGLSVTDDDKEVGEIIREADLSVATKVRLLLGNWRKLHQKGKDVGHDLQTPRTFKHHRTMPADQQTLTRIEPIMERLIDRIRQEFGPEMRLFCFDVGILPNGNISIFEFQIPFNLLSYPYTAPHGKRSVRKLYSLMSQHLGNRFLQNMKTIKKYGRRQPSKEESNES